MLPQVLLCHSGIGGWSRSWQAWVTRGTAAGLCRTDIGRSLFAPFVSLTLGGPLGLLDALLVLGVVGEVVGGVFIHHPPSVLGAGEYFFWTRFEDLVSGAKCFLP